MKILRKNLFRIAVAVLGVAALAIFVISVSEEETVAGPKGETGRVEKMIVASGNVTLDLDLDRLSGSNLRSGSTTINYSTRKDTFFTVITFNDELRGPVPSSMELEPKGTSLLPASLATAYRTFVVERAPFGGEYELLIRDSITGRHYFNIEGHEFDFDRAAKTLGIRGGRLLLADEYADDLNRTSAKGAIVGEFSAIVQMKSIEVSEVVNGDIESSKLPPSGDLAGTRPGPDVVVGDVMGLAQFGGAVGDFVGLALGTDSCNYGTVDLNWFANPNNDHPVIPQNLYRVRGGATNDERIEQVGQSSVKHAFTALTQNLCQLGCNGVGGSRLGSGCSDPYSASLNSGPSLGSKAWINPFTGFFPRNDSATPNNSHTGHNHSADPTQHRILTKMNDLNTTLNGGATYYAEGQYVTPHEYAWCVANPTQCNMNNNVSYRRYNVSGTGSPFTFSPVGSTQREKAAITAWPGASIVTFAPAPGQDGIGSVGYKVSNPSPGVYRYVYAVHNQNLERAIRSFAVSVGSSASITNVTFHAPPQHSGSAADGTVGNAGFSSDAWTASRTSEAHSWSTDSVAVSANANAIRWGTMYTFSFDSDRPPTTVNATLGFFKTGEPVTIQVQGPSAPLAAFVSVSGRVFMQNGTRGIGMAFVTITDSNGNVRTTPTNPFGNYRFGNVVPGGTYTIAVRAKNYTFTSQQIQITDNVGGLNFTALP